MSQHTIQSMNEESPVCRPLLGDRDPEGKTFGRKRLPLLVEWCESGRPLLGRHFPRLLKTPAEDDLCRFVVKKQITLRVDEKQRDTKVSRKLPNEDELDGIGHL